MGSSGCPPETFSELPPEGAKSAALPRHSASYLFYDDAAEMLEWHSRVLGWIEKGRWEQDGKVHNAEMRVGESELWLDGGGREHLEHDGKPHAVWVGVWVDDLDAMYERVLAAGVEAKPPEEKPYGVRMLTVTDPAGYQWGFMTRTD